MYSVLFEGGEMDLVTKIVCHLVEDYAISTVRFTPENQTGRVECSSAHKIKSLASLSKMV